MIANGCNRSPFCQGRAGLFPYRKVQPNGLILFCLAGLSEPLSAGEEEVFLFSRALISYRPNPERCLALLASFLSFFNRFNKTPSDNLKVYCLPFLSNRPASRRNQRGLQCIVGAQQVRRRQANQKSILALVHTR